MEDLIKLEKLWKIGTYVRIIPDLKNAKTLVEYTHEGRKHKYFNYIYFKYKNTIYRSIFFVVLLIAMIYIHDIYMILN